MSSVSSAVVAAPALERHAQVGRGQRGAGQHAVAAPGQPAAEGAQAFVVQLLHGRGRTALPSAGPSCGRRACCSWAGVICASCRAASGLLAVAPVGRDDGSGEGHRRDGGGRRAGRGGRAWPECGRRGRICNLRGSRGSAGLARGAERPWPRATAQPCTPSDRETRPCPSWRPNSIPAPPTSRPTPPPCGRWSTTCRRRSPLHAAGGGEAARGQARGARQAAAARARADAAGPGHAVPGDRAAGRARHVPERTA